MKAGSIIPVGPVKQSVSEQSDEPVVLNIYPGADAVFRLYEDEGDNLNYESGHRSMIEIRWDDSARKLVIGRRDGEFEGMQRIRTFKVSIEDAETTVLYDGRKVSTRF